MSHVIVMKQGVKHHACIPWQAVVSMALSLKVCLHWLLIKVTTGGRDQLAWISISVTYQKKKTKNLQNQKGRNADITRDSERKEGVTVISYAILCLAKR